MKITIYVFCLVMPMCVLAESFEQESQLVLVSAKTSSVEPLSMLELRQLYLGLSITKKNTRLVPLRNYSDQLLKQMFLQKVIFLSSRTYERQLLRRTFSTGSQRPKAYNNDSDLITALKKVPGAITIMWRSKAISMPELLIVQDL